jgi:hypothetical protein
MESQCLIDITNFIKTKNNFKHFFEYIYVFLVCCDVYIFGTKYILSLHHIIFKNVISLEFDLFEF